MSRESFLHISDTCEIFFIICLHVSTLDIFFFLPVLHEVDLDIFFLRRGNAPGIPRRALNKWEITKERFCLYQPSNPREKTDWHEDWCGIRWTVNFDKEVLRRRKKIYAFFYKRCHAFWHFGPRVKKREDSENLDTRFTLKYIAARHFFVEKETCVFRIGEESHTAVHNPLVCGTCCSRFRIWVFQFVWLSAQTL